MGHSFHNYAQKNETQITVDHLGADRVGEIAVEGPVNDLLLGRVRGVRVVRGQAGVVQKQVL